MSLVVDTSLLVRRVDTGSAQHPVAIRSLGRLAQSGEAMSVVPQNVYEFWVVATRPAAVRGLGLSVADAIVEREYIEKLFTLRQDPPDLYDRWTQIVAAHGISGKPAHDARA